MTRKAMMEVTGRPAALVTAVETLLNHFDNLLIDLFFFIVEGAVVFYKLKFDTGYRYRKPPRQNKKMASITARHFEFGLQY